MMPPINARHVCQRLQENNLPYARLQLQDDCFIIISERGGRVFGPFCADDDESIFWINSAFASAAAFRDFLDSGDWNMGGERIWISPEIQFSVRDRTNFWGSIRTPSQMDPGAQVLRPAGKDRWEITQNMILPAYNLASGQKYLHLNKWIEPVKNPLRTLKAYKTLQSDVQFVGYQQTVQLASSGKEDIVSESWNLLQVRPGGQMLIPTSPNPEYYDYFASTDDRYISPQPWGLKLQISGERQYKIGIPSAQTFGRLAYLNHLQDGRDYLIIRNYFNNPSASYAEEPPDQIGQNGYAIHIYNDSGQFGGFGELEVHGQTIGGDSGRSASIDQFVLWFYLGAPAAIKKIALLLLGASI